MYKDRKIVICVPAGRKRYLEILFPILQKYRTVLDRIDIWVNTLDGEDLAFIYRTEAKDPAFYNAIPLPKGVELSSNKPLWQTVCKFYKFACDIDTVYIKVDDDIVWVDSEERFRRFLDFRIDHPEYFMISANVINNSLLTHMHQRFGTIPYKDAGIVNWNSHCKVGLWSGEFAEHLHKTVWEYAERDGSLTKAMERFRITPEQYVLFNYERIAINWVSWLGEDLASFGGDVPAGDEEWLCKTKAKQLEKPICIFFGFIVSHLYFGPQRQHCEAKTDFLQRYREDAIKELKHQTI